MSASDNGRPGVGPGQAEPLPGLSHACIGEHHEFPNAGHVRRASPPLPPRGWPHALALAAILLAAGLAVPALQETPKAKKYALLVGVRSYDHRKLADLKYTENDAEELARVLRAAKYDEVVVLTTTRGEKAAKAAPTKANIDAELNRLLKKVTKRDVVLIGLAGHGVQYEVKDGDKKKRDESFFCPSDARLVDTDDFDELAKTMLPFRELFKRLDDSGAGSRLLLVDACRNDPGSSRNADTDAMPRPTRGTAALFSCKGGERAYESGKLGSGHGVFFYHVIEALRGEARDEDGEVSWDQLTVYVRRQVTRAVPRLIGGGARQTPHLMANVEGDPVLLKVGKAEAAKGEVTNSIGMKFRRIPAGKFMMGSPEDEKDRTKPEGPRHEVEITKDFYLGVYEVTQKQYKQVMGTNPSHFRKGGKGKEKVKGFDDTDDFPVEMVTYEDVTLFLEKLNKKEKDSGRVYRLPTEAEWEYACRAGTNDPFNLDGKPSKSITLEQANIGSSYPPAQSDKDAYLGRTVPVGRYKPNAWGLHDMHGNVSEWCADWYGDDTYTVKARRDPSGPAKGGRRMLRGGSFDSGGFACRSAFRYWLAPDDPRFNLGFRVAFTAAGK